MKVSKFERVGGNAMAVLLILCFWLTLHAGFVGMSDLPSKVLFPVVIAYVYWWFWQLHKNQYISYGVRPALLYFTVAIVLFAVGILEQWCWAFSLGWDCHSALISGGNWHNIIVVPAMLMFFLSPLYMFLWCLHVGKTHVQHKLLYQMLILLIGLGLLFSVGYVVLFINWLFW